MNVLFISPNYPPEHWRYVLALRNAGHNALCVGDAGDETFPWELRGALTAYRRVSDLHEYDEVYRAAAGYVSQYGRIERVETLNPHWRDLAEALRGEFCRPPLSPDDFFRPGHELFDYKISSSQGRVVSGSRRAARFVGKSAGYPILAEPARDKRLPRAVLNSEKERKSFFGRYPDDEFYLSCIPKGQRVVITGYALPDSADGEMRPCCRPVAACAHVFSEDGLTALPVLVPEKIALAAAKYPGFFSAEAVRLDDTADGLGRKGSIIPISMSDTPPVAPLVDCLCAEYNVDFRRLWAEAAGGMDTPVRVCKTALACRRFDVSYTAMHERILGRLGAKLIRHGHTDESGGFGDYIYVFSGNTPAELRRGVKLICE